MVGSSTRSGITAATRFTKSSVFVTRYPPGFTAKGVKDDLLLDDRVKHLDINVEQVQTKYDTYASFHVTCVCKEADAKLFLGPDLWPSGILYRQWRENRKPNVPNVPSVNNRVRAQWNNVPGQGNAGLRNNVFTHGRNGLSRSRRDSI